MQLIIANVAVKFISGVVSKKKEFEIWGASDPAW